MILGFAHITKNIKMSDSEALLKTFSMIDDNELLVQRNLINAPEKNKLMTRSYDTHDLILHKTNRLEYLGYDELVFKAPALLSFNRGLIELNISNLEQELRFWTRLLDFESDEASKSILLTRPLVDWSVKIQLNIIKDQKNAPYPLNSEGFVALAFYTRNLKNTLDAARKMHIETSDHFIVKVADKGLNIAYVKSPSHLFVELIEVMK